MYRSARMWRSALCCAALALVVGCGPKKVESPLEKAPPPALPDAITDRELQQVIEEIERRLGTLAPQVCDDPQYPTSA